MVLERHGAGGVACGAARLAWEILKSYREAMVQAGIPRSDDFNRGDNEGCGFFMVQSKRVRALEHFESLFTSHS